MEAGLGTYVTYNPLAVSLETGIDDLLRMVESLAMHHFPVVDQEHRLIGVVSETDLILAARKCESEHEVGNFRESITVKDIFSGHLVTVDHRASPRAALKMLMDNRVRSLPVLEGKKLVAIVTTTDFLREFSYGQLTCAKDPVSDFLELPSTTLDPEATADEALVALKNSGLEYMAVVHGGCPIGVVSGREILKSIAIDGLAQNLTGKSSILKFARKTPLFRPGQRMNEAAALMVEHGHSALAVTNQANRLLGLVTAEQILQLMLSALKP